STVKLNLIGGGYNQNFNVIIPKRNPMRNSAVERVKNQLAYKLGQALIEFDKNIENKSLMGGGYRVFPTDKKTL
ncbi:hypothetical protein, partial [Campylobacter jejuni]|uniref:hypothetical protein n=1 Tax=Campylobacter jejuni TaxID=197 RepID=UPI001C56A3E8